MASVGGGSSARPEFVKGALDLSQFDLGQRVFSELGQFDLGQFDFGQSAFIRLRPEKILWTLRVGPRKGGAPQGGARKGGAPKGGEKAVPQTWKKWGLRTVGAKKGEWPKIARFFLLQPQFSFFFLSLGGPFVEFWWCRSPQMCTFGVLGLSCEAPAEHRVWTGISGARVVRQVTSTQSSGAFPGWDKRLSGVNCFPSSSHVAHVPVWPSNRLVWPPPRVMCSVWGSGTEGTLESAAARMCREAGGPVATSVLVRDMDLAAPDLTDSRRLEVVVDGLPLFGGCQLAVDTTLVCALHCDGSHGAAADADGVVLQFARRRKERTYPELVGPRSRARLVVLAMGKWVTVGQTRRDRLCHSWPEPGRATRQRSCRSVRSRRGRMRWGAML